MHDHMTPHSSRDSPDLQRQQFEKKLICDAHIFSSPNIYFMSKINENSSGHLKEYNKIPKRNAHILVLFPEFHLCSFCLDFALYFMKSKT